MKYFLVLFSVFLLFPLNSFGQPSEIPDWIRNNAKWWSEAKISDKDFAKGLEYLIQKDILKVQQTTKADYSYADKIPTWVRNSAGWWSQKLLPDEDFIKGIQYLTSKGIIKVSQNNLNCAGSGLCIYARVEKIVDGDTLYVEGYKVRLSLTNTPESNQVGFSEATQFTKNLCPIGSLVIIDQDDQQQYDSYGRLLGKVFCDKKILNSELLYNGHANILTKYCQASEFSKESWAQQYGCGMSKAPTQTKKDVPSSAQEAKPATNTKNCDPSYPDVCIPPYPPDLDCRDIPYKKFRVLPPDPHRFDGDKDGIGCES